MIVTTASFSSWTKAMVVQYSGISILHIQSRIYVAVCADHQYRNIEFTKFVSILRYTVVSAYIVAVGSTKYADISGVTGDQFGDNFFLLTF